MKVLLVGEGPNELKGALVTLVRRLGLDDAHIDTAEVKRSDIHVHHGKGRGYFKKALRWMLEAERRGYDSLILLIDQDNRSERLKEFSDAQEHRSVTSIRRALGVAIRTFDAWMLADEKALSMVLGFNVDRQPDPETIPQPKAVTVDLSAKSENSKNLSQLYAEIAKQARLDELQIRCPKDFAPFAKRITQLCP